MKYTAIIGALLLCGSEGVSLNQPVSYAQQFKDLSDQEVTNLVNQAVENAKNKKAEPEKKSDDAEKLEQMKALEAALAARIIGRLNGVYGVYGWPYSSDISKQLEAIKAYHDLVTGQEILRGLIP